MKVKNIPILGLGLLSGIAGCRQGNIPENAYRVQKIEYVGDSYPGAVIEAKAGDLLLEFVRFVHLVDSKGNLTIMVGEPANRNTKAVFHGISGNEIEFLILDGSGRPYTGLLEDSIVRIPASKKEITLLGSKLLVEEVSEEFIRCRVISVRP